MGNVCCSSQDATAPQRESNLDHQDNGTQDTVKRAKTLLTGRIGAEDNVVVVPKTPQSPERSSERKNNNGIDTHGIDEFEHAHASNGDRRESDATVYFDALDRFPSHDDMMYPPADSMRQLPLEFNMQQPGTLPLLLNPSSRRLLETDFPGKGSEQRQSVITVSENLTKETPGTQGRGYPGELSEEELETCLRFREELKKRNPAFKQMVMSMHPHEPEAFALCRFLRARDFVIEDVFSMMTEKKQPENWPVAKDTNFYDDFHNVLPEFHGCPLAVLLKLFPLIHTGIGKNGAIVLYIRAGEVNCPGLECVVGDIAHALPYAWNRLYHGARKAMEREIARSDPATTTVLAEKIMVVDLKGDSTLFSAGVDLLKAGPVAGSCFPETVNRTYILNAPFSFSLAWAVIKQIIDPRTVQKIGFFSTIAKAKSDFLEHIESDDLLSCYGGTGQSFDEVLAMRQLELAHKDGILRYVVEVLCMDGKSVDFGFELSSEEKVDTIVVYSRSDNLCEISVEDDNGAVVVESTTVNREQATDNSNAQDPSRNSYAIEIANSKSFCESSNGSFVVKAKDGTKGDHFLVAISIAKMK